VASFYIPQALVHTLGSIKLGRLKHIIDFIKSQAKETAEFTTVRAL
jgi:hypothetical protein